MKKLLLNVVIMFGVWINSYAESNTCRFSPKEITSMIESGQRRNVVESDWDCILTHIRNADREWLEIVPTISKYADGWIGEILTITLGDALIINSSLVFDYISLQMLKKEGACEALYIDEESGSINRAIKLLSDRKDALLKVSQTKYIEKRDYCLTVIDKSISRLVIR